jgi:translation initiation factor 1
MPPRRIFPIMAKLTSLEDLGDLLSESDKKAVASQTPAVATRGGYDGKPQKLGVRLDSKRRRGKTVTLVTGFQAKPGELEELAARMKRSCGAGGTVLDNAIEIQGDHRDAIVAMLKKLGYLIR